MLYKHMPDYQALHRYEHFNISRFCTILYSISSYKPHSRFLSPLTNTALSHLFFSDAQNWAR